MKPKNKEEMKGCRLKRHTNNTFRRSHLKPCFFSVSHISDILEKQTGPQTKTHAEGFFLSKFFFLQSSENQKKKKERSGGSLGKLNYDDWTCCCSTTGPLWTKTVKYFETVCMIYAISVKCQRFVLSCRSASYSWYHSCICVRQCKRSADYVTPNATLISWSCLSTVTLSCGPGLKLPNEMGLLEENKRLTLCLCKILLNQSSYRL